MKDYMELRDTDDEENKPPSSTTLESTTNNQQAEAPLLTLDEALELNVIGLYHYRLLVICGCAWMADALEINLLSYLASCAGIEWHLTEIEKAAITGAAFGGVILGSTFFGMIADSYGRKVGFLSAFFFVSIGGIVTSIATSLPILLISRVIVGFGIGGGNIPFDLLAELLPVEKRGSFLIFVEYFWTFGSAFVSLLAWMYLDRYGWRFLALITIIPVVITSLFAMYYLPESPRWLLTKNRLSDAEKILYESMKCNGMVDIPDFRIRPLHLHEEERVSSEIPETTTTITTRYQQLQSSSISNSNTNSNINHYNYSIFSAFASVWKESVTIPLWTIWFCFGFGYYGFLLFISRLYSSSSSLSSEEDSQSASINDQSNNHCSFDYSNIFYNSLAELVGVSFCIYLLNYFGRIHIQICFYGLGGITTFLLGCLLSKNFVFMIVALLGRMSVMISSEVTWVITPELYPTNHRTFAHAICVSMSKVGAFLSPFVIISNLSIFGVGSILSLINIIAVIACYQLPETGKLQLGLLDENSHNNDSSASMEVRHPMHDDHEMNNSNVIGVNSDQMQEVEMN